MKIKTLEIYGYGKWVNQKFELGDQLQLFYGKNEAGKSTLQSFIRSMLFGFPSRRRRVNQQNRYEPKQHETYGGRMLLTETDFGDIWVERTSKTLRVTRTDGEELPAKTLDEVLGGLDEKLFDNFYAFSLQNLQELANIGADQLNDYFMRRPMPSTGQMARAGLSMCSWPSMKNWLNKWKSCICRWGPMMS